MVRNGLVAAAAVGVVAGVCGVAAALPPNVTRQQVLGGLNQPVTIDFLPGDGRMLVLHKPGHILLADPTALPATTSNYLTLTDIDTGGFERGLMDIAFDPDFANNGFFYLYYSHASSGRFRISRFTHMGDHADLASEVFVWENNTSWGSHSHYGGGMGFGPDGKLYLTIGDDFDPTTSQDLGLADGKLIRINSDGTIPANNPFVGQPGVLPEIWAYGLRNPFRAKWDLSTGRFIIAEVGGNDQNTAWEDVCIGVAGANYGWPACEGFCDNPAYEDPIFTYAHLGVAACMTGGMVYRGAQFSSDFYGAYFYADYSRGWVRYLTFDEDGTTVTSDTEFDTNVNSIVDFQTGPNGAIYYARLNSPVGGGVWRYVYDADNQPPSIVNVDVNAPVASAPVTVTFSATVNDPEMDPLEYTWIFGDGQEAAGASVMHTYAANGRYAAYLRVTDPTHVVLSGPITVQVGLPPEATITAPVDGAPFRAGDVITFTGAGVDPDGVLATGDFAWTARFIHAGHSHGTSAPTSGTGGSLIVPTSGHEFASDTHYEIILTVTDADGLTGQAMVRVFPETVHVTVESTPPGARIVWDGKPLTTPFTRETLIDFQHTISASGRFCLNQAEYGFDGWSDGGAAEHVIAVPDHNLSLAAAFSTTGVECELPVESGLAAWYRTDAGVSVSGGVVAGWQDQSGAGLHMVGAGQPQLVANAINGFPSIRLDGVDDRMERIAPDSLAPLPAGNAPRTMLAIVKYNGPGFGGLTYGSAGCNEVFGLSVTPDGRLMIHGWCGGNDFFSAAQGTNAGWMLNEVVYKDNVFHHYKDGVLINSGTHAFGTNPTRVVLGAEIDTTPHVALEVAELLVYDRALTDSERLEMENYLLDRYFAEPCVYDLDGNAELDVFDLLLFLDDWFAGCP